MTNLSMGFDSQSNQKKSIFDNLNLAPDAQSKDEYDTQNNYERTQPLHQPTFAQETFIAPKQLIAKDKQNLVTEFESHRHYPQMFQKDIANINPTKNDLHYYKKLQQVQEDMNQESVNVFFQQQNFDFENSVINYIYHKDSSQPLINSYQETVDLLKSEINEMTEELAKFMQFSETLMEENKILSEQNEHQTKQSILLRKIQDTIQKVGVSDSQNVRETFVQKNRLISENNLLSAHIVEIENSIDKEKRLLESKTKEIEKMKHVYKLQSGDLNLKKLSNISKRIHLQTPNIQFLKANIPNLEHELKQIKFTKFVPDFFQEKQDEINQKMQEQMDQTCQNEIFFIDASEMDTEIAVLKQKIIQLETVYNISLADVTKEQMNKNTSKKENKTDPKIQLSRQKYQQKHLEELDQEIVNKTVNEFETRMQLKENQMYKTYLEKQAEFQLQQQESIKNKLKILSSTDKKNPDFRNEFSNLASDIESANKELDQQLKDNRVFSHLIKEEKQKINDKISQIKQKQTSYDTIIEKEKEIIELDEQLKDLYNEQFKIQQQRDQFMIELQSYNFGLLRKQHDQIAEIFKLQNQIADNEQSDQQDQGLGIQSQFQLQKTVGRSQKLQYK